MRSFMIVILHQILLRDIRRAYKILVGKPEGRKLLGRPRCRWEDNIKMDVKFEGRVKSS
jgi:hypothetical protein